MRLFWVQEDDGHAVRAERRQEKTASYFVAAGRMRPPSLRRASVLARARCAEGLRYQSGTTAAIGTVGTTERGRCQRQLPEAAAPTCQREKGHRAALALGSSSRPPPQSARSARPDAAPLQTMAALVKKTDGFCDHVRSSTLAAFLGFAARAATRCSGEAGLLGAAPASSLGEDTSWRSLGAAAVSACVWAFFCAVAALLLLAAARPSFGSSARRRTLNRHLAGVLLASAASLAAAGPANASVAPFSDDIFRTRRELSGYIMDDLNIRTARDAWFADPTAAEATYGHISTWVTAGVTDMGMLFCAHEECNSPGSVAYFNEDISAWITSGVTNMHRMFDSASAFNQDIGGWSVGAVTDMDGIFKSAWAFNQDLGWCVDARIFGRGGDFVNAFEGTPCASWSCGVRWLCYMEDATIRTAVAAWLSDSAAAEATYGHISTWDTSGVTSMSVLFYEAPSFNQDLAPRVERCGFTA